MTPESFSPVIEILRGGQVESIHGAAAVVVDCHGDRVAHLGDPELPVYWRSAAKPFQAWPLIQSGAADSFSLSDTELALACASHGGEERHVEVAAAMLARGGYSVNHLQCGPHPPMTEAAAQALLRAGETPTSLHNNCSGKHAGMLLLGSHLQADPGSYLETNGAVQTAIRAAMTRITGVREPAIDMAVDGCSAPTFRLSLHSLALAYARLGASLNNGDGDPSLARLARAMTSHPGMVAGEGRLDTALMEAVPGALIAKLGAEGIYAVGLAGGPQPLGLAVKIADGDADRARTALILSLLDRLGAFPPAARDALKAQFPGEIYNRRGIQVGTIKVKLEDYLVSGGN